MSVLCVELWAFGKLFKADGGQVDSGAKPSCGVGVVNLLCCAACCDGVAWFSLVHSLLRD